jgi:hypothetical protein
VISVMRARLMLCGMYTPGVLLCRVLVLTSKVMLSSKIVSSTLRRQIHGMLLVVAYGLMVEFPSQILLQSPRSMQDWTTFLGGCLVYRRQT